MLNETINGNIPVLVGKTKQFKNTMNDMFENFYEKYNQTLHPGYIFLYNYMGYVGVSSPQTELYQLQTLNVHLNNVKFKSVTTEGFYLYDKEELKKHFCKQLIFDLQAQGIRKILPIYNKK
jgi:hypothetical protein